MNIILPILAGIGALSLILILIRILATIVHYTSSFSYTAYKGEWAVITGASAGIGEAFVRGLAKKGLNVVLLARSQDKMRTIATACESDHSVKTLVIPFDFSKAGKAEYASLAEQLKPLNPSVLVNNVGVNVEMPTDFVDMEMEDIDRIVNVNINSTNAMTAMLLPQMVKSNRGIVLCLSSAAGSVTSSPLLAPYSGTKGYNHCFAISLAGEVATSGVHVHSLTPFFVETGMAKMRSSLTVPKASTFADSALRLVGGSPRLQPHWPHYLIELGLTALPLSMQVSYVAKLHRKIRRRALRKKERFAKQN